MTLLSAVVFAFLGGFAMAYFLLKEEKKKSIKEIDQKDMLNDAWWELVTFGKREGEIFLKLRRIWVPEEFSQTVWCRLSAVSELIMPYVERHLEEHKEGVKFHLRFQFDPKCKNKEFAYNIEWVQPDSRTSYSLIYMTDDIDSHYKCIGPASLV